ncbi:hypothetical protein WA026_014455 [Henosepilachna vigintioctopunctata]|uniref:Uncharacterized protein n=1 Tax=Henosepilachna vigintioctopunctata TaxID=420089 RepID=A0AAW1UK79_9CUCU
MKSAVPRIVEGTTNPRKRRAGKHAKKIQYPNLPSTSSPVQHSEKFPVPSRPQLKAQEQPVLSQIYSESGSC